MRRVSTAAFNHASKVTGRTAPSTNDGAVPDWVVRGKRKFEGTVSRGWPHHHFRECSVNAKKPAFAGFLGLGSCDCLAAAAFKTGFLRPAAGVIVRALVLRAIRRSKRCRIGNRGDAGQAQYRKCNPDHVFHLNSPSPVGRDVRLRWTQHGSLLPSR